LVISPLRFTSSNCFFFQLNTCVHSPYVTPSLTRGWVCRLQLLLDLASTVILGSESHRTHDHISLSQIRDSSNLEGQVPEFISPKNRVAQLYPRHSGFHFCCLLRLAGLQWNYSTLPLYGIPFFSAQLLI
jgi:hypothetical protein